jgi:hypothetical protein
VTAQELRALDDALTALDALRDRWRTRGGKPSVQHALAVDEAWRAAMRPDSTMARLAWGQS